LESQIYRYMATMTAGAFELVKNVVEEFRPFF